MTRRYEFHISNRVSSKWFFVVKQDYRYGLQRRGEFVEEVRVWANDSLDAGTYFYDRGTDIFYFSDELAAMAFKMRWC